MSTLPTVAIIGAGSSGIAAAEALHERDLPFDCFESSDRVGGSTIPHVPHWLDARISEAIARLHTDRPERYGLPQPDHRLREADPTVSGGILDRSVHGTITPRPDIAQLGPDRVQSADGMRAHAAIMPLAEAQGQSIGEYLRGEYHLPARRVMESGIRRENARMRRRCVASDRQAIQVDFVRLEAAPS